MQDLKNNPFITILLAVITIISGAMFASNLNANNQLWNKLDRMTSLFIEERNIMRADIKDLQKVVLCHDQDLVQIKERMTNHLKEYEREMDRKADRKVDKREINK